MRRAMAICVLVCAAIAAPLRAAEFDAVVKAIGRETNLDRRYIPFLSIGRLFVRAGHPEGVHDFKLAVFTKEEPVTFSPSLVAVIRDAFGEEWSPVLVANSKAEQTLVFGRPQGELMRLVVVANDDEDLAVIQVDVDPERMGEFVDEW